MFIVEVIPLISLPPQVPQLLSYFFNKSLQKGAVVEVLINNRKTLAIVVGATSIEEQKASLKKSDFQLKKISNVISEEPKISDAQFKIALWLSKNYYTPLGLCLKALLPPFFLKEDYGLNIANEKLKDNAKSSIHNLSILLTRAKTIIKDIEPEIKKTLSQKRQILIIVPEISVAQYFYDYFAGYYETALIHSKVSQKKYYTDWNRVANGEMEIIIGTRLASFSPFNNLGLIIVEDPANETYKSDMSPKYDTPDLVKKIAEIYSCKIIFVSRILDIKTYYLIENERLEVQNNIATRQLNIDTVDMIQELKSGNFSLLSRNLGEQIKEYAQKNKKILIFSSRRGYSGVLLCENCSFTFKCSRCSVPFKIHRLPVSTLICHRCSSTQQIPQNCPNCHSYKLKAAGFPGTEKIKDHIDHLLQSNGDKTDIFVIDSSFIKTVKAENELINRMKESESYICIATQMIFSHRFTQNFDLIGIINVDSLTTVPDFRSEEQLFYQFEKLLDFKPNKIIIQTYNTDSPLLNLLVAGEYTKFYEKELQSRKIFGYPPFIRLIKLSFASPNKNESEYEARILSEKLKMAISQRKLEDRIKLIGSSPAFVEKQKNLYIYNVILKISPEQKPDEILRFVPSYWAIDIDPKSIL